MALEIRIADFREQGVRLISPKDRQFEPLARPRIGPEADIVLAKLMPYIAAVVNESPRAIVGLETFWSIEAEGRPHGTGSQLRYPEGVFRAGIGRDLPILPGDVRIVAAGVVVENWPGWANYTLDNFHEEIPPAQIELKVVIFDDGLVLGEELGWPPGVPGFLDHFRASLDVRREWYQRALRDLEEGKTDSDVLAPADELLEGRKRVPPAMLRPLGVHAFDAAAEVRMVMQNGREAAIECLRLATSRPQFELRRG